MNSWSPGRQPRCRCESILRKEKEDGGIDEIRGAGLMLGVEMVSAPHFDGDRAFVLKHYEQNGVDAGCGARQVAGCPR